ncbi:MAG: hypothetical protein A4E31_00145 [Methanomassiliicoccales archaeon PtaU1.Bin030]|nr:MAG: hypothetical protein A4E31_00145 [Methanomassiliicoccales archaeon PtaU1.Bin030]
MSITADDLTDWLGPTFYNPDGVSGPVLLTQVQAALAAATRYCAGYMSAKGVSGSGDAYDSAVESVARGHICLILDSMGLKPASYSTEGSSMSSDAIGTASFWFKQGDEQLERAVNASVGNRRELYFRHIRGNRGIL